MMSRNPRKLAAVEQIIQDVLEEVEELIKDYDDRNISWEAVEKQRTRLRLDAFDTIQKFLGVEEY